MIGVIIAVVGFTVALWINKLSIQIQLAKAESALSTVTGRLGVVENLSDSQGKRIENLTELRKLDSTALSLLVSDMKELATKDYRIRSRLQKLETDNATVKEYMDRPLPPELACVHNDDCPEATPGDSDRDKN